MGIIEHLTISDIENIKKFYGINVIDEEMLKKTFASYFTIKSYFIKDSIDVILRRLKIRRVGNKIKIDGEVINLDKYDVAIIEVTTFTTKGFVIILIGKDNIRIKIENNNNKMFIETNNFDVDIIECLIFNLFIKHEIKSFRELEKPLKLYYTEYVSPDIKNKLKELYNKSNIIRT